MDSHLIKNTRLMVILFVAIIFTLSVALNIYLLTNGRAVTKRTITAAAKIIGLEFTRKEKSLMADELEENLARYEKLRKVSLPNSVMPALDFDPQLHPTKDKDYPPLTIPAIDTVQLPQDLQELPFLPIPELAGLIKSQKITSTQLTQVCLDRLKRYDEKLHCVITLTEELALKQAQQADEEIAKGHYRGLLHGIPYGIKDLFAVKGYRTTWGARPYQDQMIDEDATVVQRLREAGAVLVAKLSMGALAWGDVWFGGKTRNPWDVTKGSSGSSAGSAAAVSAGLVPFTIGTETWGSIVSPCTVCGVTGLRPTFGRVSRKGAMALSWTMDKIGPICRNAEDCAIVFNAIYGPDGQDQSVVDIPFNYNASVPINDLRIGFLKTDFDRDYAFHKNDSLALEKLREMGATLIPVELPSLPVDAISFILNAEAAAAFDELTRSGKDDQMVRQIKEAWPNVFRASRFIPAVEYINANRVRVLLMRAISELMADIDLYVAPSWQGDNLLLTNLTGHPCVVVPNGFSDQGTPTSFCFVGKLFNEGTILAVAQKYQQATGYHLRRPNLDAKHAQGSQG